MPRKVYLSVEYTLAKGIVLTVEVYCRIKWTAVIHVKVDIIALVQSQFRTRVLSIGKDNLSLNPCDNMVGPGQVDRKIDSSGGCPLRET
jgi:hypothetical protein